MHNLYQTICNFNFVSAASGRCKYNVSHSQISAQARLPGPLPVEINGSRIFKISRFLIRIIPSTCSPLKHQMTGIEYIDKEYITFRSILCMYISALLFGISANIDTFVLGFSYGIKKQHIPIATNLMISLITFFGTLLSIGIGIQLAGFLSSELSQVAGSLILILLGLYYCWKYLWARLQILRKGNSSGAVSLSMQSESYLSQKETFALGIALTINNAGMGIGASFAGIHFLLTSVTTFFLSALFLIAGNRLGTRFAPAFIQCFGDLLSGLIIIALGFYELTV